jgi:hypothetical protein
MSDEFARMNEALGSSVAGRGLRFLESAIGSAWRTSSTRAAARSINLFLQAVPRAQVVRGIAMAVAVAAAMQPFLMRVMPATVRPAIPWPVFAVIALLSGTAAWRAQAVVTAWPSSALARWLGR